MLLQQQTAQAAKLADDDSGMLRLIDFYSKPRNHLEHTSSCTLREKKSDGHEYMSVLDDFLFLG